VSRRSCSPCRQRPCYKRSQKHAAPAPRPSAAAAGHHPRRWRPKVAIAWMGSNGAAVPITWHSVPSFRGHSATHGGPPPNDVARTSAPQRTCIITTPDVG